jgi:hypothetical protein
MSFAVVDCVFCVGGEEGGVDDGTSGGLMEGYIWITALEECIENATVLQELRSLMEEE